ncbi:MAG: hypothetical protein MUQ65_13195 [Armatimonadetes bacterium]|nr:hypothetical protein [Armatimonadota bacterium]
MTRVTAVLICTICLFASAGCKSSEQARVYGTDMETTWAAAIRVVEDLTSAAPDVANEEERRIVTKWTPLSSGEAQGAVGTTSSSELARGVIRFIPVESGTRVSIKVDKQARQVAESVGRNTQTGTVGIVIGGSSGGLEQLFLDRLAEELSKGGASEVAPGSAKP